VDYKLAISHVVFMSKAFNRNVSTFEWLNKWQLDSKTEKVPLLSLLVKVP